MSDDGKALFLVLATLERPNPWTRMFFVRAASLAAAYRDVLNNDDHGMFQHPNVRLEGHVVSLSEIPHVKMVAEAYWNAGRQAEANPNHDTTFEEFWEENGATPEDD